MKQNVTNIKCNFTETKSDKKELTSFFEISTPFLKLNSRFNDLFFKYDTNELNLVLWIHLTGTVNNENNPSPIATDNWVSTVIYVANKNRFVLNVSIVSAESVSLCTLSFR